jgi:DNA-binding MarR family transcriptional regulator
LTIWQGESKLVVITSIVITGIFKTIMTTTNKKDGTGKWRRLGGREEEAFVSLLRTGDVLSRKVEGVLKAADISPVQYNVLRILRGAPEGLPCVEIANRLINRYPDISRLLDRMEKRKLISRCRETEDRRMVQTRISETGLKLLADLDGPVLQAHWRTLGHLGEQKLNTLLGLLAEARQDAG